jgi:hypothetical protein
MIVVGACVAVAVMQENNNTTKNVETVAEFNDGWKGRGTLANLVTELERQKDSRVDFVADVRHLEIEANGGIKVIPKTGAAFEWMANGPMPMVRSAYHQLADRCNPSIPTRFFDALMTDRPNRLADLINGLHSDDPQKRLVRCLDGKIRAWLSNSYRVIDNLDIAFTCLDAARKNDAQVFEASLSEKSMRIKFTTQQVWDKIDVTQRSGPQGEWYAGAIGNKELMGETILSARIREELPGGPGTVHPVVTVLNSETGHGGFHVRYGILMGICFNVATLETVVSRIHLGERLEEGIFSQETISLESKAIMSKARDAVAAAFDQDKWNVIVAKAKQAQSDKVESPTAACDNVIVSGAVNEEQREALMTYFLRDYDQTRFGFAQAISRLAQDQDDPDYAGDLESLAGKIIKEPALVLAPK